MTAQATLDGQPLTLKSYLKTKPYPDVYFDTVNMCAMIDSSIPILLVAPPSGAKTTIIKVLEKYYETKRFVYALERISPMRFLKLQDQMNGMDNLLLSEDFSTLGDEEGAVFKMATIIAKLSYDKKYIDPFFTTKESPEGLRLIVKSLAFVCGMQPLWLQIYGAKEVFETLIMEKILRYYRLPIMAIKEIAKQTLVIESVLQALRETNPASYTVKDEQVKAIAHSLAFQCGARGIEYANLFATALSNYVPEPLFNEWLYQTAHRFEFENKFMLRGYEPLKTGIKHEALYREYTVLFFAFQYFPCTYDMIRRFCKIRGKNTNATKRYMRLLIRYGLESGYITVHRSKKLLILPSKDYRPLSMETLTVKSLTTENPLKPSERS